MKLILVLSLLFSFLIATGCGGASKNGAGNSTLQTARLFEDATNEGMSLQENGPADGIILQKRFVKVNTAILKQAAQSLPTTIQMNFFEDKILQVFLDQVQQVSPGNYVFTGKVVGDNDSAVSIALQDGIVVANVRKGDVSQSYEVRSKDRGIHTVELRQDSDDNCEEVQSGEPDVGNGGGGDLNLNSNEVIDILAAYTPNARAKHGGTSGIKALIETGIADTNRALGDSGSSLRVRLVGTLELRRNESGSWSRDLDHLKSKTDGFWDEVHAERARLGADQVSVVATYPNPGGTFGIGFVNSGVSSAFTIVRSSAFGMYTFSHELGHNLGLNHYNGYVNPSGRFRTIIAYGSYPRIRRYANPSLMYNGFKTGTSSHNEISIINSHAAKVAGLVAPKM